MYNSGETVEVRSRGFNLNGMIRRTLWSKERAWQWHIASDQPGRAFRSFRSAPANQIFPTRQSAIEKANNKLCLH